MLTFAARLSLFGPSPPPNRGEALGTTESLSGRGFMRGRSRCAPQGREAAQEAQYAPEYAPTAETSTPGPLAGVLAPRWPR